jgi:hypothetical protein
MGEVRAARAEAGATGTCVPRQSLGTRDHAGAAKLPQSAVAEGFWPESPGNGSSINPGVREAVGFGYSAAALPRHVCPGSGALQFQTAGAARCRPLCLDVPC